MEIAKELLEGLEQVTEIDKESFSSYVSRDYPRRMTYYIEDEQITAFQTKYGIYCCGREPTENVGFYTYLSPDVSRPVDIVVLFKETDANKRIRKYAEQQQLNLDEHNLEVVGAGLNIDEFVSEDEITGFLMMVVNFIRKTPDSPYRRKSATIDCLVSYSITTRPPNMTIAIRYMFPEVWIDNRDYRYLLETIEEFATESFVRTPEIGGETETHLYYYGSSSNKIRPPVYYKYYQIEKNFEEVDFDIRNMPCLSDATEVCDNVEEEVGDEHVKHCYAYLVSLGRRPNANITHTRPIDISEDFDEPALITDNDDIVSTMKTLLQMINRTRILEPHYLREIASAINNTITHHYIINGEDVPEDEARTHFNELVNRHHIIFSQTELDDIWNRGSKCKRCTISTLMFYAELDTRGSEGMSVFEKWHRNYYTAPLMRATSYSDTVLIAEFVHRMLRHRLYAIDKGTKVKLYHHDGSCLVEIDEPTGHFANYINEGIVRNKLTKLSEDLNKTTGDLRKRFADQIATFDKILKNLSKGNYVNTLVKQCLQMFTSHSCVKAFDTETHFTALTNGVIEIYNDKPIYREGKLEDLITKATRLTYNASLTKGSPSVLKLVEILKFYFVDDYYGYMLRFFASRLHDGNTQKKAIFVIGPTGSGKTTMFEFFNWLLGDLGSIGPTSMLSYDRNAGADSPTPAATAACAARVLLIPELGGPNIAAATFKRYTGGDTMSIRRLFGEQTNAKMNAIFVICANNYPTFDDAGEPTITRVTIVPMEKQFSKNAPLDEKEMAKTGVYKIEDGFVEKLRIYSDAMLFLMMKNYGKYIDLGLKVPPTRSDELILQYIVGANEHTMFFNENVKRTQSHEGKYLTTHEVTKRYIKWAGIKPNERTNIKLVQALSAPNLMGTQIMKRRRDKNILVWMNCEWIDEEREAIDADN